MLAFGHIVIRGKPIKLSIAENAFFTTVKIRSHGDFGRRLIDIENFLSGNTHKENSMIQSLKDGKILSM